MAVNLTNQKAIFSLHQGEQTLFGVRGAAPSLVPTVFQAGGSQVRPIETSMEKVGGHILVSIGFLSEELWRWTCGTMISLIGEVSGNEETFFAKGESATTCFTTWYGS